MKIHCVIAIVLTAGLFGACKKEKDGAENVTITFTEPSVGDTIPSWNQVHMEGTVSGDGEMKGYVISALNATTNEVLFTTAYDVTSKAYNFHEHWINNLYDTTSVTVKVEVIKNEAGDRETATRTVVCLP
ncbi:hypothetical protein H9Y05_11100 [Crocinitomicaceae bacterium CZZ-1]|uniref:Uncharacterized protein n=1 Tax=Taishania pollutisoli TaxID=2766479 RepID=A0A8J6U2H6_9FLAO|nr:hypothetical protein [Taishania pollutisoli]MBC9813015.1 hypothetical protein [Taishania pollutisoli]MBX2948748.1 hypothetical protein [Crocinitomicaceae bacterium]NGF75717.1 hypothetical protein [Fluviicola sp. SGL-29]